jgi:lipid-binding SYLF domain-containing protein
MKTTVLWLLLALKNEISWVEVMHKETSHTTRRKDMKFTLTGSLLTLGILLSGQALADFTATDAAELETEASAAVATFKSETTEAETLLNNAKGVLVCPKITKGGFIIGVEGGKCVMRVGGKTVEYYRTRAGKLGLLAGIQWYSLILVFNDQAALDAFRTDEREWEVGVDASVAVAEVGASGKMDTTNLQEAIVAFMFGEKGLMADLSLEGSNFKKINVENK